MLFLGCDNKLYLFSHLSSFKKNVGQKVYIEDVVAEVGNTGYSNGSHLHVQLIISNTYTKFFDKSNGTLFDTYNNCFKPFDYEDSYSNPIREEL